MPRDIRLDGLALTQAYDRLGELTDINSDRFSREIFLQVRRTASGVSSWQGAEESRSPEQIWDSTKAYLALGFSGGVYVGICPGFMESEHRKNEPHEDTNLGNNAPILKMALDIFDRVRFCSKPSPAWYEDHLHLFSDLEEATSRNIPKEI